MEYIEFTGKTVDDAITEACQKFTITSDRLEYEVIEKGTGGIFGFAAKPAVIKARVFDPNAPKEEKKETVSETKTETAAKTESAPAEDVPAADPKEFLGKIFDAMNMKVNVEVETHDNEMDINLSGEDMGVLIGKRGQTLDALQYLTSLVVNRACNQYYKIKLDTENYRKRSTKKAENKLE